MRVLNKLGPADTDDNMNFHINYASVKSASQNDLMQGKAPVLVMSNKFPSLAKDSCAAGFQSPEQHVEPKEVNT